MPRPKIRRKIRFNPGVTYFKPRVIPLHDLEEVSITRDEMEAVKLYFSDGLDQTQSAEKMGISQPTFARTIDSAVKKIADALVKGKSIKIENSDENENL